MSHPIDRLDAFFCRLAQSPLAQFVATSFSSPKGLLHLFSRTTDSSFVKNSVSNLRRYGNYTTNIHGHILLPLEMLILYPHSSMNISSFMLSRLRASEVLTSMMLIGRILGYPHKIINKVHK